MKSDQSKFDNDNSQTVVKYGRWIHNGVMKWVIERLSQSNGTTFDCFDGLCWQWTSIATQWANVCTIKANMSCLEHSIAFVMQMQWRIALLSISNAIVVSLDCVEPRVIHKIRCDRIKWYYCIKNCVIFGHFLVRSHVSDGFIISGDSTLI